MGKRSRQKRLAKPAEHPAAASPTPPAENRPRSSRPCSRRARLAFGILSPFFLLCIVELVLRLVGYGYSSRFFEKTPDGKTVTTNPQFAWQFYPREIATTPTPVLFSAKKSPGTLRIFVLGESAAAGTPDPAFGFARMLEVMLARQYPQQRFEVINAAMRGINSHVIHPIARECAVYEPDLFVVYMGNNELIGLHSPTPGELTLTSQLWLLRLSQQVKATRLAQLTQSIVARLAPERPHRKQEMEYVRTQRLAFDDRRREAVYENFEANLRSICNVIQGSSAPAVLSTVGVNQRDFPPLGSLHRPGLSKAELDEWERKVADGAAAEARGSLAEAIGHFESALRIDDHFAELHFRMARVCEALQKHDDARKHFALARDWDALQFRADSRLNSIVRQVATNESERVHLVDAEQAFTESSLAERGIPGHRLFHEHVHLTFEGDHHLARTLAPTVAKALKLEASMVAIPSRDECAQALAFTPIDAANVRAAMVQQTGKPPFLDQWDHARSQAAAKQAVQETLSRITVADFEKAAEVYRDAMAKRADDWMLRLNYANLLSDFGRHAAAVPEYEGVVRRLPRQRAFRIAYGNALLQSGRTTEAAVQFSAALEVDPQFKPAREALLMAQRKGR